MHPKVKKILRIILLAVFVVSTCLLIRQWLDNDLGDQAYDDALNIAIQSSTVPSQPEGSAPSESPAEETSSSEPIWVPAPIGEDKFVEDLKKIDIAALQAENPEVIGWIYIPYTNINYPLMQGQDNEYYLNHAWNGYRTSVGSIFLEHRNAPDLTDFNSIVYGHHMRNGSMFADIARFKDPTFFTRWPYVYIATSEGICRYEVYSSYEAPVDSPAYGLSFQQVETRETFISYTLDMSVADAGIIPAVTDRILTLSTCTGRGYDSRWVVHARLPMIQLDE